MHGEHRTTKLAEAVRALFVAEYGELRQIDWIEVGRELGMMPSAVSTPKPDAAKNLEEIVGINLEHALETYDWGSARPLTYDGVTVSGIHDASTGQPPRGYAADPSGRYLRRARG